MLWNREDLAQLKTFAGPADYSARTLSNGDEVQIERWVARFPEARPDRLVGTDLSKTYTTKPLVACFGEKLFGELAIVRCLEMDGWSGVWVDTFHGPEIFWRDLPFPANKVDLSSQPDALNLYRRLVRANGKPAGFFDVFAWKDDEYLFVEYKGKGDKPNENETRWIESAVSEGVGLDQLLFVESPGRR